jgi:hypothetical protein
MNQLWFILPCVYDFIRCMSVQDVLGDAMKCKEGCVLTCILEAVLFNGVPCRVVVTEEKSVNIEHARVSSVHYLSWRLEESQVEP